MAFVNNLLDLISIKSMLLFVMTFLMISWWIQRPRNMPPGPWRWPFLGHFPQLVWYLYKGEELHELITRLGDKHGKLYSVDLFGQPFIVMNEFGIMREGFNNPLLNNKGHNHELEIKMFGRHFCSYKNNDKYRKFALSALRQFGIGKWSFEENIATESKVLCDHLTALKNHACNPKHFLTNSTVNVLLAIIFGRRYELDDEKFRYITSLNSRIMELLGQGLFSAILPIPNQGSNELSKLYDEIYEFMDKLIEEQRQQFDPENLDDFIDVYFNEKQKHPEVTDPDSFLQATNMRAALYLLFIAGSDTTSTTLEWCCLYMMAYPEIQKKIQEELDFVVGRNRLPQLSDRAHLPYTRAALLEIQRNAVISPLSIFHTASAETLLCGYRIPKGSIVISNLYAVMKDPKLWPDPNQFKPERFINDNGEYVEPEEVCPFGVGRRICLGESLAKMELYVFFTHLLHRFSLVKPDNTPPITFEGKHGVTFTPKPFSVRFIVRD